MKNILRWIRSNRIEFLLILLILLVAVSMRFYRINEYMTFLGDEGRDAIVIKKILTEFDLPLLGPPTSIGNMYLGPLYYYMMTVPMAIFWLNPVAAASMVAIIGTLTVGLIYYLAREWFGKVAAIVSAVLYAFSSVNVYYSRSSWNPNPAPFFTLLAFLGLFKAHRTGNFKWFILTGVSLAFAVQMHYLALILLPVFGILWLYELLLIVRKKLKRRSFISGTIISVLAFLFLMSPLVIFDLRHNFMNYRALTTFFGNRETTVNVNPFNTFDRVLPIYENNLIGRYLTAENYLITIIVSLLIILPLVLTLYLKVKGKALKWPLLVLGTWLVVGVGGLALYKQNIYDHYLGFINPAPFLLLGSLAYFVTLVTKKPLRNFLNISLLIVVFALVILNVQISPLKNPPNNQLERTQEISKYVIEQSGNKPFNFALIAKSNYDAAYQFYLDLYGYKPKQVPFEITDQLFVVCEDDVCQPINHPKYEIAAFGWSKIDNEAEFKGVKVFKLIHNTNEEPGN